MTARKVFKSAALFLTVGLVVLALTPGLAPADTFTVRAGGGSIDSWPVQGGIVNSPTPVSYAAGTDPHPGYGTAAASASAGPGIVGVIGRENYPASSPYIGHPYEANSSAEANLLLRFTDLVHPAPYTITTSANLA